MRLDILALLFLGGTVTVLAVPEKIPLVLEEVYGGSGCGCYFADGGVGVFAQCAADGEAARISVDGVEELIPRVSGRPGGHEIFRDAEWAIDVRFHDGVAHCPSRLDCEGEDYEATIHVVTSTAEALVETRGGCGC